MSLSLAFALLALAMVLILTQGVVRERGLAFALAAGCLAIAGTFVLYLVIVTLITSRM